MRISSRIAGAVAALGLVIGEVGGALMHVPPFLPQRLLQNPIASMALVLLAIVTVTSLVLWARLPRDFERLAFVMAITSVGLLTFIINVLAPVVGWWGGPVFDGPLVSLALLTGLRAMFGVGLVLLLYRWLAARWLWLARLIYLLILLALIPGISFADRMVLESGVLTFGNGYMIWHDVVLGEVLFVVLLVIYEVYRRRRHGK